MLLCRLDTYFLEVSAHALLKIATKVSFRGKKSKNLAFLGYFSEVKTEEYDYSKLCFFFIILERSHLVQIHTVWKLVHVFLYIIFWWLLVAQNEKLIEQIN